MALGVTVQHGGGCIGRQRGGCSHCIHSSETQVNAVLSELTPFYSAQDPSPWKQKGTLEISRETINKPNLDNPSQMRPDAHLLSDSWAVELTILPLHPGAVPLSYTLSPGDLYLKRIFYKSDLDTVSQDFFMAFELLQCRSSETILLWVIEFWLHDYF